MSPISDCDGAIRHILLTVTRREGAFAGSIYQSLMASLSPAVRFTMVCEAGAETLARGWLASPDRRDRVTLVSAGQTTRLTMWARDPVIGLGDQPSPRLMRSPSLKRVHDRRIGGILQRQLGWNTQTAPCDFEGGNLLIGDDFALVGADTLAANGWPGDSEAISRIGRWLCLPDGSPRRIVPIASRMAVPEACDRTIQVRGQNRVETLYCRNKPGSRQPLFHIDLFLTLGGRDSSGQAVVFVGDPNLARQLLDLPGHDAMLAAHFDDIADQLADLGFRVIRLAMPLIYMDFLKRPVKRRVTFFASSNNSLVEICRDGSRTVWLSAFAHDNWPELALTDDYNRQLWEQQGFRVVQIPQGQLLAENFGGLHCMANIIAREPPYPLSGALRVNG